MRAIAWIAAGIVAALVAAAACGSSSNGGGAGTGDGGDGGNPAGCPSSVPAGASACAPDGLRCSYGACSQTTAACSSGAWSVATSNIACTTPPATDRCAAAGGRCTCGGRVDPGFTTLPGACPPLPPGSGACGAECYVPVDGGCGGATCTLDQTCCASCNDTAHHCVDYGQACDSRVCPADAGADG